ncbi:MAG: putative metallophosphoesterase [Gemmatimonadetes bacterium]|nr:putative metallophosphoesterase [Gemmatimonadota bacterium]
MLGAFAGAAALGGYTWRVEPHWVKVVERDLPIENLPASLVGKTMIQLSDIHIGPDVDDSYIIESFARVAALAPDILVITGDFFTHRGNRQEEQWQQLKLVMRHMPRGRLATIGVLGNHDYGLYWRDMKVAGRVQGIAEHAGVHVLRNESVNVQGLDFVGTDDLWSGTADPMRALAQRSGDAAIVLCHNPDAQDELQWGDYRGWVLAGHTHGGQCKPPFLPPPLLPVKNRRYVAGEVEVLGTGRRLYINRGLGHLQRVRFNVRPEITRFALSAV